MNRLRGRDWLFLGLVVAMTAVCLRLALWQLSRLEERQAANASILERLSQPVLEISPEMPDPQMLAFRRVRVRGIFDAAHQILLKNRSYNGQPGYHLVTPLQIEETGQALLIDRGWVPIDAAQPGGLSSYRLDGEQEITGIIRGSHPEPELTWLADKVPAPGDPPLAAWRVLNIEGIQNQIPYPILPFYVAQTESEGTMAQGPIPDAEIDLSEGPHLGYTIQWVAFAAIAFLGGSIWFRRRLDAAHAPINGGKS